MLIFLRETTSILSEPVTFLSSGLLRNLDITSAVMKIVLMLWSVSRGKFQRRRPLSYNVRFEPKIEAKSFVFTVEEDMSLRPFVGRSALRLFKILNHPEFAVSSLFHFNLDTNRLCVNALCFL